MHKKATKAHKCDSWYSFCMGTQPTNAAGRAKERLRKLGVSFAVLFGSAATGVKRPEDRDVALFLTAEAKERTRADFDKQFEIIKVLADFMSLSPDDIDAVFMGPETAPLLAYHIARDGKLLLGDERTFMRFRLHAIKVYQDTEKFRAARWHYLKKAYHV